MLSVFGVRWRKIVRDLWSNRTRTILVVASIAVGIFAVGTVQYVRTVVLTELQSVNEAAVSEHASISTNGVSEAMLEAIRREPSVADVQGRSALTVKVQVTPDTWENFQVSVVDDFDDMRIRKITRLYEVESRPDFGANRTQWPADGEIILESGSLDAPDVLPAGVRVGAPLNFETAAGKQRTVTVSGVANDPNSFPAVFTGSGSGYVNHDTFDDLGGSRSYGTVYLRVDGTPEQLMDAAYIQAIADRVADKIERAGYVAGRVNVPEPGEIALQTLFDALALLLTPLGLLALLLSGFLLINTISALMAQQVRQIGIMKAIGARRGQIVAMYIGAVLLYSVGALVISLPLTLVVAGGLASFLGDFINVNIPRWSLPTDVILLQIFIGILVPLLAAAYPIHKGTSVTVREAVSDYGTGSAGLQEGWITRILASIRGLSRPMQLSMRNTFRRRGRLALTLLTLVMGGMIFMTVGSVRASLNSLIETGLNYYQFDIQITFDQPYRAAQVEQVIGNLPQAGLVESWNAAQAVRIRPDGTEGDPLNMTALMAESEMVQPTMSAGRWLVPADQNAIVLSQNVLASEPEIEVGDTIVLEINDKRSSWVVVGIAQVLGGPPNVIPVYVNYPYFARFTSSVGQASSVQVKLTPDSSLDMDEAARLLNEQLEDAGFGVASVFTIATLRRLTGSFFDIIVYLLLSMGVLIAAVGALGLMGTMSTNVLERTREIGVMRAIGASDWSVLKIVIVEGVFIGWLSWLVGALLAFPAGALIANTVGLVLFQTALPYTFSASGLLIWFTIVTVLATVASYLPAWNASRLTVREVLAYQ